MNVQSGLALWQTLLAGLAGALFAAALNYLLRKREQYLAQIKAEERAALRIFSVVAKLLSTKKNIDRTILLFGSVLNIAIAQQIQENDPKIKRFLNEKGDIDWPLAVCVALDEMIGDPDSDFSKSESFDKVVVALDLLQKFAEEFSDIPDILDLRTEMPKQVIVHYVVFRDMLVSCKFAVDYAVRCIKDRRSPGAEHFYTTYTNCIGLWNETLRLSAALKSYGHLSNEDREYMISQMTNVGWSLALEQMKTKIKVQKDKDI